MRILQVVQKPQRRGAETFAYLLSRELRKDPCHEVRIIYLYPHDDGGRLPLEPGDACLRGVEDHSLERSLGFHPSLLLRLSRLVREFRPDIVQVNGSRTVKYGALCRSLPRQGSWSLVYRNIGEPQRWIRGLSTRLFYRYAVMPRLDAVVGVARTTLDKLLEFHALDLPSAQIPRAIDPEALVPDRARPQVRAELDTPAQAPVIVCLGSLTPEKRVDRLLRVLRRVHRWTPDARLWIVGDGPLRSELEAEARKLRIHDRTAFLGTRANVADYLAAAEILALASDTEGMPGVILEAAWLERPAVATDVGGVSECLLGGKTGLLVEPGDEASFAGAISRLLENEPERVQMGRAAREWVERHYTIETVGRRYVDFYREIHQS